MKKKLFLSSFSLVNHIGVLYSKGIEPWTHKRLTLEENAWRTRDRWREREWEENRDKTMRALFPDLVKVMVTWLVGFFASTLTQVLVFVGWELDEARLRDC